MSLKRTRLSELRPWVIQWEYTARFISLVMFLLFPLVVVLVLLKECLKGMVLGFLEPLTDLWDERGYFFPLWGELWAQSVLPWESDL